MRTRTETIKYWSVIPWGWQTKTVTYYDYHFRNLSSWRWGVFERLAGCEDDGKWYAWTEPAFNIFGSTTYFDVTITKETPLIAERDCSL